MAVINREINIKTLAALKRVYDVQFELYEYALSHGIPIGDTEDTFIRRTLGELADASEKILTHINLNTSHDLMYTHVRTAFTSIQNSRSVLNSLFQIAEEVDRCSSLGLPDKFVVFKEKLETAMADVNKTANILKTRLVEGF